jgi:hypothetical protein
MLMDECKVAGEDRRLILERFLPYSALPANVQAAHLEALEATRRENVELGERKMQTLDATDHDPAPS